LILIFEVEVLLRLLKGVHVQKLT